MKVYFHTLLPIIHDKIAPGTIIHSDKWGAYKRIEEIEERDFEHLTEVVEKAKT